ncbi:MAG TPA: GNAT family N-acetyltransferase [Bacteroidia bacterium]|nr:GNAT family N-acetyltransferase [Bacteroidia bacterium]
MHLSLSTPRLTINPISINDYAFIQSLLNTPGWIQFIGDRKIHSEEAAKNYLQKILDNPNVHYWIVRLKDGGVPIGIVTFMIRNYLEDYDFGFAFLPEYGKQGFAFEAASEVLKELKKNPEYKQILAITLPENISSINLLERLGFMYDKNILIDNEELKLFIK